METLDPAWLRMCLYLSPDVSLLPLSRFDYLPCVSLKNLPALLGDLEIPLYQVPKSLLHKVSTSLLHSQSFVFK